MSLTLSTSTDDEEGFVSAPYKQTFVNAILLSWYENETAGSEELSLPVHPVFCLSAGTSVLPVHKIEMHLNWWGKK